MTCMPRTEPEPEVDGDGQLERWVRRVRHPDGTTQEDTMRVPVEECHVRMPVAEFRWILLLAGYEPTPDPVEESSSDD